MRTRVLEQLQRVGKGSIGRQREKIKVRSAGRWAGVVTTKSEGRCEERLGDMTGWLLNGLMVDGGWWGG